MLYGQNCCTSVGQKNKQTQVPEDGYKGLKTHFVSDLSSGFLVFLIALPLSLGIAKASDFPPIMGLITAMVGGVLVSWFSGSLLTIKGPAAGLIIIVAGSVQDFGNGDNQLGWHLALGAMMVAGVVQILFGFIRLGSLADFFPLSAVHGMLTAIGITIIAKQFHVLMGVNPLDAAGNAISQPLDLLMAIPRSIQQADTNAASIGVLSLIIVLFWNRFPIEGIRKIPQPLVVLFVAIPMAAALYLPKSQLIHFDQDLEHTIAWNERFDGVARPWLFVKYVLLFSVVGSLESLLTVKAIDAVDPYKRKSNANKDLMAVGFGNVVSAVLGGLPMIAEVARSSANVNNGAKTRWSNFYHGLFMLVFLFLDLQFSDIIPFAALAAMLIGVGIKLASPKEFGRMAKIGPEQLLVFCVTIVATLATDLLIGILVGVAVKLLSQWILGVPVINTFKASVIKEKSMLTVFGAAVFSNWLGLKKILDGVPRTQHYTVDLSYCNVVDHTVMNNLLHLEKEFAAEGGLLSVVGLDDFISVSKSNHRLSTRTKTIRNNQNN